MVLAKEKQVLQALSLSSETTEPSKAKNKS